MDTSKSMDIEAALERLRLPDCQAWLERIKALDDNKPTLTEEEKREIAVFGRPLSSVERQASLPHFRAPDAETEEAIETAIETGQPLAGCEGRFGDWARYVWTLIDLEVKRLYVIMKEKAIEEEVERQKREKQAQRDNRTRIRKDRKRKHKAKRKQKRMR